LTTFAFVFARGGSKGLPGKNIKPLGGIPLLGHSIRIALATPGVEKVFVSTDDQEIADVAVEYGAAVIMRPPELATDTASEWLAWQHAVNYVRAEFGDFQTFVSLPATSPLRAVEDVEKCLEALTEGVDVVVTVTEAARSPYFNMVVRDAEGISSVVLANSGVRRRQDAPAVYDMTTVAYVTTPDFILKTQSLFEGKVRSVIVPKERAADIDDAYDFLIAEALYEKCR